MSCESSQIFLKIQDLIRSLPANEFSFTDENSSLQHSHKVRGLVECEIKSYSEPIQQRVLEEFFGWGPLKPLFSDESLTEILVNGPSSIWVEKNGVLEQCHDRFFSDLSYRNCLDRICQQAQTHITVENPCADGQFHGMRLSVVGDELTRAGTHLSFRRHPKNPWTFIKLHENGWCHQDDLAVLQDIIQRRQNFLVVGSTGSGKTSVLNSFLQLLPKNERLVVIEDASEIVLPNTVSMKLLTREDPGGLLPGVDQCQLVKRSLRLRPDRLVMGEVRGAEAKDFLMALATGHTGSFGTLHASDAHQALIRLEMLIQMGAPQWSLQAIRRLIQLSLNYIVVTEKNPQGLRRLRGIYRLCSLEEHGFLLDPVKG